jgi:hypothetical protein
LNISPILEDKIIEIIFFNNIYKIPKILKYKIPTGKFLEKY